MSLRSETKDWDLIVCPFCKGTRMRMHTYRSHGEFFRVMCLSRGCGALGPVAYDAYEAADAWNAGRGA